MKASKNIARIFSASEVPLLIYSQINILLSALRTANNAEKSTVRTTLGGRYTVLGVHPTEEHSVGCFAVFGDHSVERFAHSRFFGIPFWTDARQTGDPSGI